MKGFCPIFQLLDVVLMVRPFSIKLEELLRGAFPIVRDIEKVSHFGEQIHVASNNLQILL
jgi:hypothetical protein